MELESWGRPARGLRQYLRLVAAELNCPGDAFAVQLESPLSAYIPLEDRVPMFPELDMALLWDERTGWYAVVETPEPNELIVLSYLDGGDVLPEPEVVGDYVRKLMAGEAPGSAELTAPVAADDLLERLGEYAQPEYWSLTG